jgi:hypothetical protein
MINIRDLKSKKFEDSTHSQLFLNRHRVRQSKSCSHQRILIQYATQNDRETGMVYH